MIYQRPLAYLLAMEGVALLRSFAGDHDRAFTEARIAEIRQLLDHPALAGDGVEAARIDSVDGYRAWSVTYDAQRAGMFGAEDAIVHDMLGAVTAGTVLDAACGSGRQAEHLAAQGHRVIGVDSSPEMLDLARARVPDADFRLGGLDEIPLPDDSVDAVVCTLALTHVPDLGPSLREFARVLRPGGHLVTFDVHHELVALGSVPRVRSAAGEPGLLTGFRHRAGDYLRAALPVGFQVRRCEETGGELPDEEERRGLVAEVDAGQWDTWPWSLLGLAPAAVAAAWAGTPTGMIWHFQLDR